MLPRLKPRYTEEIVKILRKILKDNTVDVFIIDMQATVIAFSLREFFSYLKSTDGPEDEIDEMRRHIFKEAAAVMQDMYDIYSDNPNNDPREWYDGASQDMLIMRHSWGRTRAEAMYRTYFERLDNGAQLNCAELIAMIDN